MLLLSGIPNPAVYVVPVTENEALAESILIIFVPLILYIELGYSAESISHPPISALLVFNFP